jgi:hypothetical protein
MQPVLSAYTIVWAPRNQMYTRVDTREQTLKTHRPESTNPKERELSAMPPLLDLTFA